MITEDYVSFETAKLLKDKGFDAECDYFYVDGELVRAQGCSCNWNNGETLFADYKNECSAPTLQMAMTWVMEYGIDIAIYPYGDNFPWDNYQFDIYRDKKLIMTQNDGYITYKEACEAAIKYCLENLI